MGESEKNRSQTDTENARADTEMVLTKKMIKQYRLKNICIFFASGYIFQVCAAVVAF